MKIGLLSRQGAWTLQKAWDKLFGRLLSVSPLHQPGHLCSSPWTLQSRLLFVVRPSFLCSACAKAQSTPVAASLCCDSNTVSRHCPVSFGRHSVSLLTSMTCKGDVSFLWGKELERNTPGVKHLEFCSGS